MVHGHILLHSPKIHETTVLAANPFVAGVVKVYFRAKQSCQGEGEGGWSLSGRWTAGMSSV